MKCPGGIALMLALAVPAWAQDQATIDRVLRDAMQAYGGCIHALAVDLAQSTETPQFLADRAIEACREERHALWMKMQAPPLSATPDDATDAVRQTNEGLRPMVIDTIRKARGG